MKIDWPVVCAFTLIGLLFVLPGQRVDSPAVMVGCGVFVVALIWLGVGIVGDVARMVRK